MTRTPKQIAAAQRRSLRAIRQRVLAMAAEWGDVDQFVVGELEDLAAHVEDAAVNMIDDADVDARPE